MRIKQAIDWGVNQLPNSFSPRLDAEVLLAFASKKTRTNLYQIPNTTISPSQLKKYKTLIAKRATSIPIAHITHQKEFFDIIFHVNSNTLIPRPETEAIVTSTMELARNKNITTIYDVGTGCGNIAIALAKNLPNTNIIASDICKRTLQVAKRNVVAYKLENQIKIIHSNLTEHITTAQLIVANLPYVPEHYKVSKDILFEPPKALFAGVDGLDIYKKFFSSKIFKVFRGVCVIELGVKQFELMSNWLAQHFPGITTSPINNIDGTICGLRANFN